MGGGVGGILFASTKFEIKGCNSFLTRESVDPKDAPRIRAIMACVAW